MGKPKLAFLLSGILLFGLATTPAIPISLSSLKSVGAENSNKKRPDDKRKNSKPDALEATKGYPILWQEPPNWKNLDLFYGPGGRKGAPDPAGRFTFIERSTSGTSKKIHVEDDRGRKWTVKFGAEAKPETTATRIAWAVGYFVDQDYFIKRVYIEGGKEGKGFEARDVRFERRDDGYKDAGLWDWKRNPFVGTRELQGLKVLMALCNNWDLKIENNKILVPEKTRNVRIYYVSDLGATFGSTGSFLRKILFFADPPAGSKGDPKGYADQEFIEGVRNGQVVFHYKGKDPGALEGVTVANARWMGNLLGRLSNRQLSEAFRAGGFSESEVAIYVETIRERIRELQRLK
jgi:hypothetical protein